MVEAEKRGRGEMLSFAQDVEFFLRRAERNAEQEQYWEALLLYRKAVEAEPSDYRGWQGLSDTYSHLGCNYTAMRSYLNILWACAERPGDYEYRLAHKFIAVEEYSLGMRCFQRFVQDSTSGEYVTERTLAEKLIYLWDESQEGTPSFAEEVEDLEAWLLAQSGLSLLQEDDAEGGIALLEEARDLAPDNVEIALVLATSLWPLKRYQEAAEICEDVVEIEDDNIQAHCLLALIADETGDGARRYKEMLILRSLAYYSPQEILQAGMSLADLGDYEHAHFLFKEGYQRNPSHLWLAHAYATCSLIIGQAQAAVDVYMRLHRLLPENPSIAHYERKMLAWQGRAHQDRELLVHEFPLVFMMTDTDVEKYSQRLAMLANPFVVVNMKDEGIETTDLPMLLRWGLEREDGDWQRLALLLALRIDQETALFILQSYLTLPEKWCKAKRAACDILFCLGQEQSFHGWSKEGKVRIESDFAQLYSECISDPKLPFQEMQRSGALSQRELRMTVYLWQQYVHLSDRLPAQDEVEGFGDAMRILAQNMCNQDSRVLITLRGCPGATMERIQEVLEPHFLPVLVTEDDREEAQD